MSQKVLVMTTVDMGLRSKAESWDGEDSSLYVDSKPVGRTPTIQEDICFANPLMAMSKGWKLLGPPTPFVEDNLVFYNWWFVKE